MGFLSAAVGGVIYLNYAAKKGYVKRRDESENAPQSDELVEKHGEVPLSESIDKLTIQVALIAIVYLLTFAIIYPLSLIPVAFIKNTLAPLLFGFNIIIGTMIAMLVKKLLALCKRKMLLKNSILITSCSSASPV
jgi:ESS family glutamate:Na+ symporter